MDTSTCDSKQKLTWREKLRQMTTKCRNLLTGNLLLFLMMAAIVIAIVLGVGLRYVQPPLNEMHITIIKFPGELLIRVLQLLVLPLIGSTLISGVATLGTKCGKIAVRALVFYALTTITSVLLGVTLVSAIKPGTIFGNNLSNGILHETQQPSAQLSILDLLRNLFPSNIITALFTKAKTRISERLHLMNATHNFTDYEHITEQVDGFNILGLVTISIMFGITIRNMGTTGRILRDLSDSIAELTLRLATVVIWFAPIGILCLIAGDVVHMPDPATVTSQVGMYVVTSMLAMLVHGFIILPLLYLIVLRKNPYAFIASLLPAFLAVCGTASSAAVIPVTYQCLERKGHVDHRVSRFVIPVGATMNMNSMALYEAVACMFIAQRNGYDLYFGRMIIISTTATVASIGAAAVPQGIVTMITALTALGLPTEELPKILAMDWLLDRIRDVISILGDCMCAAIVQHLSRHELVADIELTDAIDSCTEPMLQHVNTESRPAADHHYTEVNGVTQEDDGL